MPGWNDSEAELSNLVRFLAGVSRDIPWHVTAFHPDYRMSDRGRTTAASLLRAARLGEEAGLRYVYAGNIPGMVKHYEDTRCPQCQTTVVERTGYLIRGVHVQGGRCASCGAAVAGVWRDVRPGDFTPGRTWPQRVLS